MRWAGRMENCNPEITWLFASLYYSISDNIALKQGSHFLHSDICLLKVSKFQNDFMKLSFFPKCEPKMVSISVLYCATLHPEIYWPLVSKLHDNFICLNLLLVNNGAKDFFKSFIFLWFHENTCRLSLFLGKSSLIKSLKIPPESFRIWKFKYNFKIALFPIVCLTFIYKVVH